MKITIHRTVARPAERLHFAKSFSLAAVVLLTFGLACALQAQSDNFDDGNDQGWTHYDPIKVAVGSDRGTWTFPSGAYRIQSLASPAPSTLGPGRIASLRTDVTYSDFYLAADIVGWD